MNPRVTEDSQPPRPVQRLRLTFSKDGPARFISHLDLARALERALNRAALPVAYTQGFNRRPRLSLAAALPLGYSSAAEVADVWLTEAVEPEVFRARLMARMAPGIVVLAVVEAPLAAPSLQQQLSESVYEVGLPAEVDVEALRRAVVDLLAADALVRQRHRPKDNRSQSFDLRPLILDLVVDERQDGALWLRLRLVQSATQMGRPDDVLAALGLEPLDARVHRLGLRFAD
jgi:radical SAM-linked protein